MHRRRPVQEKPVQKWLGNNIPIFRKNVTGLKKLEESVEELAASCTYEPAGSNKQGIRQKHFEYTQSNQPFVGWRDLDTAFIHLLQVACSHRATYLLYRSCTEMLG